MEQKKKTNEAILKFIENYFLSDEEKNPAMVAAIAELLGVTTVLNEDSASEAFGKDLLLTIQDRLHQNERDQAE